mmetsp:Transcript_2960/g.3128  ORF Transcript_2960/g.3128 Transcript_2960/m.3128 type:complete len:413 (+) Transcript_2960:140-1378(+)
MDIKLMRDFEELEGVDEGVHEGPTDSFADDEEIDETLRPHDVSTLSHAEILQELEARNIAAKGFPEQDRVLLHSIFVEEFQQTLDENKKRKADSRNRALRQADLQRKRLQMEKMLQEEQEERVKDYQTGMMIDLIKENMVEPSIRVDVNSISARSLAKAMWLNTTVTCMDLSSNNLDDHAGSYLARILKRNNCIVKIELDNNQLASKTCQAFGEALKVNTSLTYLSLDSNPLTSNWSYMVGFTSFADALRSNKTLRSLNLWRTNIGPQAGATLANAMQSNSTLLFVDVGYCGIDMDDVKAIVEKKDENLAAYERVERERRLDTASSIEIEKKQFEVQETLRKQKDLAEWLESRRDQRAETKRVEEEERLEKIRLEHEEKARVLAEIRERERKAAEEAEAKKKKKKAKAKAKK